jgi:hemerythrin-like metal-binding protein
MAIKWSEAMSCGEATVDAQHKKLVALLNAIGERALLANDMSEVEAILDDLGEYAKEHFCYEEACMDKYKCPFADKNREEHQRLLKRVEEFKEEFAQKGPSHALARKLEMTLTNWIIEHLLNVDLKLKASIDSVNG